MFEFLKKKSVAEYPVSEPQPQERPMVPFEPPGDELQKISYACRRIMELLNSMEKPHNGYAIQRARDGVNDAAVYAGVASRPAKKK